MQTLGDRISDKFRKLTIDAISRDTTVADAVARLDGLAIIMDSAFTIPGTKIVIGLDAILGLLPVIGDAIAGMISGYIILEAKKLGAPRLLVARMAGNAAFDTLVGSIPVLGDVFDVAFKANRKNVALLKRHIEKHGLRDAGAQTIDTTYSVR